MELWEVTNSAAGVGKNSAQSSYKAAGKISSDYSKILAEKISNLKADVEEMEKVQEKLDEIDDLQKELTHTANISNVETIKRFMPDGSILVTTYKDGKITEQYRKKPHMVEVPNYFAPPKEDGSPETKLEPRQRLDLTDFLMM